MKFFDMPSCNPNGRVGAASGGYVHHEHKKRSKPSHYTNHADGNWGASWGSSWAPSKPSRGIVGMFVDTALHAVDDVRFRFSKKGREQLSLLREVRYRGRLETSGFASGNARREFREIVKGVKDGSVIVHPDGGVSRKKGKKWVGIENNPGRDNWDEFLNDGPGMVSGDHYRV